MKRAGSIFVIILMTLVFTACDILGGTKSEDPKSYMDITSHVTYDFVLHIGEFETRSAAFSSGTIASYRTKSAIEIPPGTGYNIWITYTENGTDWTSRFVDQSGTLSRFSFEPDARYQMVVNTSTYEFSQFIDGVATAFPPRIEPNGGTFDAPVTVSMSSETIGAAIYYTTDGTTPTTSSLRYYYPVTISASCTLKAIAATYSLEQSEVVSAVFTVTGTDPGDDEDPPIEDTTRPAATLTTQDHEYQNYSPITLTLMFDEEITELTAQDLTVTNGTAELQGPSISAGPYTITVTPTADGEVTVTLPENSCADGAGNGNTASETLVFQYRGVELKNVTDIAETGVPSVCYAVENYHHRLLKLDLDKNWIDSSIDVPHTNPIAVEYESSENVLYIAYAFNSIISRYSLDTNEFLPEYSFSAARTAKDIRLAPGMDRIVVLHPERESGLYGSSVSFIELSTGTLKAGPFDVDGDMMAVADTARKLYTGNEGTSPSSLYRYSIANDTVIEEEELWDAGSNGQHLSLSADEQHLVFACGGGNEDKTGVLPPYSLADFDPADFSTQGTWDIGTYPLHAVFSHDGNYLYGTSVDFYDNHVYVMRSTYQLIRTLPFPNSSDYTLLCLNSDGTELVGFSYDDYNDDDYRFYFFENIRD